MSKPFAEGEERSGNTDGYGEGRLRWAAYDDDDEADDEDDFDEEDGSSLRRHEQWSSRPGFASPEWWSRT